MEDDPKPKHRPALRHALGGLALVVCIGLSMWLIERGGDSIVGDWCVAAKARVFGPRAVRDQVQIGMTADEVNRRIGFGTSRCWYDTQRPHPSLSAATESVDYGEYGFRIVYRGREWKGGDGRAVLAVEDLP